MATYSDKYISNLKKIIIKMIKKINKKYYRF